MFLIFKNKLKIFQFNCQYTFNKIIIIEIIEKMENY